MGSRGGGTSRKWGVWCGNFDIVLDNLSRISQLYSCHSICHPRMRRVACLTSVTMLCPYWKPIG